jgi:hypothetical protein
MRLFVIFLLAVLFIGCDKQKEKLKAREAFFVQPQSVTVSTLAVQGTASNKITDLWYYVNGEFKGAYPVGNILPIPSTGPTQVQIFPGIKNNGISETRLPYEFYQPIILDTSLAPGTVCNRNFTFQYKSSTKFKWIEDFEGWGTTSGISIKTSNNSDTDFVVLDKNVDPQADVFEDKKCFYFALAGDRRIGQYESISQFVLPKNGATVYLELDYKCTAPFEVGVYSGTQYIYLASVSAKEFWNKIYIQLSSGVSTLSGNSCGLYFRAFKASNKAVEEFRLDNIKILSY